SAGKIQKRPARNKIGIQSDFADANTLSTDKVAAMKESVCVSFALISKRYRGQLTRKKGFVEVLKCINKPFVIVCKNVARILAPNFIFWSVRSKIFYFTASRNQM